MVKRDTEDIRRFVEVRPQRQDSLKNQMADLLTAANRLGLYDAYDWVRSQWEKLNDLH